MSSSDDLLQFVAQITDDPWAVEIVGEHLKAAINEAVVDKLGRLPGTCEYNCMGCRWAKKWFKELKEES